MECQSCGEEVEASLEQCPGCGAALDAVAAPPPDPGIRLTPVFRTGDAGEIAVAKSLLEGESIEYLVRADGVQDLFGWGRLGSGYSIITGPAEFLVRDEDGDRARELLHDLGTSPPVDDNATRRSGLS